MFLILSCEDGTRKIIECPPGADPETLAQQHGTKIYDLCDSKEEAERRMTKDPNGKPVWC